MLLYSVRRLAATLPVLIGISVVVFLLVQLIPGDVAATMAGPLATPAEVAEVRESLGLDRPFYVQYGKWLQRVIHLDLGRSIAEGVPVTDLVLRRFKNTVILASAALVFASVVGGAAGIIASLRPGTPTDRLVTVGALIGNSMPSFWLGIILIVVFSLNLGWLPSGGMYDVRSGSRGPLDLLRYLLLPAVTLGAASAGMIARMTRSSMLEVLNQDYIRTARAKGVRGFGVVAGHALRNACIPVVTAIGLQAGFLLGGAAITETVFSWPGLGSQMFQAISKRDLPLIQGGVLFVAAVFVFVNLAVDLAYGLLNPRIRYQ